MPHANLGQRQTINFHRSTIAWRRLIYIKVQLLIIFLCLLYFGFTFFQGSRSVTEVKEQLAVYQKQLSSSFSSLEAHYGQNIVALLAPQPRRSLVGVMVYLNDLARFSVPKLWLNEIYIEPNNLSMIQFNKLTRKEISARRRRKLPIKQPAPLARTQANLVGATLQPTTVQVFYAQLRQKGPFSTLGIRVAKLSGVQEVSAREKRRRASALRRGKKVNTRIQLETSFSFVISNIKGVLRSGQSGG